MEDDTIKRAWGQMEGQLPFSTGIIWEEVMKAKPTETFREARKKQEEEARRLEKRIREKLGIGEPIETRHLRILARVADKWNPDLEKEFTDHFVIREIRWGIFGREAAMAVRLQKPPEDYWKAEELELVMERWLLERMGFWMTVFVRES